MRGSIIGLVLTVVLVTASPLSAYSVLTHEAAIDVTWDTTLRPLLLQRFPRTSADGLVRARAFAYGGSVIQDLGYMGHPGAVNVTVPMVFPKLQRKYGDTVTYAQAPRQHV
jgi:hypothetical protein